MNILQKRKNGWSKDDILVSISWTPWIPRNSRILCLPSVSRANGDYPEEQVLENPEITVEGIEDEGLKNKWEYYVNQVYEMISLRAI
mgnify:CR=1 FL=1